MNVNETTNVAATETTNVDAAVAVTAKTIKVKAAKAKKIQSSAAVLPLVNTKTKKVFLRIAKGNATKSIEATTKALAEGNINFFEGKAREFVAEQGITNLHMWKSRIAQVQPQRLVKSAANQIASWAKAGLTVVNAEDFKAVAAEVQAETTDTAPTAQTTADTEIAAA